MTHHHSPTCSGCTYCDPETFGMFRGCSDDDYTPIDPYAPALLAARAASERQTPEQALQAFAAQHTAARLASLAVEQREIDADVEANPYPRLTAAEAEESAAPDPYAAGIEQMRKDKR
jgi:hypothetical protein